MHKALTIKTFDNPIVLLAPKGFCIDQKSFKKNNDIISILAVDCFFLEIDERNKKTFRKPLSAIISTTIFELETAQTFEDEFFFEIENVKNFSSFLNELNLENTDFISHEKNENLIFPENKMLDDEKGDFLSKVFFIEKNKLILLSLINYSKYEKKNEANKLLMEYVNNIKQINKKNN